MTHEKISWRDMWRVFGRIGLLSFGGPAAQIALMHKELVQERGWIDDDSYLRALSLCMLLPGPEAMQLATYAGWRLRGIGGGLLAGCLFVLPGAAIIAALVALYVIWGDLPFVQGAFLGIKAAVVVIVFQALLRLAHKALLTRSAWVLALGSFVGIFLFDLPFPLIIGLAGLWGWCMARPGPPVQIGRATGANWHLGLFLLLLWLGPLFALSLTGSGFLADIGWFFARLAVVTFGGAYAVLGYMTQTVVQDFGWISTGQMIDALGLAETTPGPLILVTQFVAMLAGYLQQGPALAIAAGAIALWATFLPCFLWIFMAAPYLDHITARPRPANALAAISAAVVGVILNLSLWFALHVLFDEVGRLKTGPVALPWPDPGSLNPVALVMAACAVLLLLVFRRGMVLSLLILAGLGGVVSLL